jgi:hypothetical protein
MSFLAILWSFVISIGLILHIGRMNLLKTPSETFETNHQPFAGYLDKLRIQKQVKKSEV